MNFLLAILKSFSGHFWLCTTYWEPCYKKWTNYHVKLMLCWLDRDDEDASSRLTTWKVINVIRAVGAILGWLIITVTPQTDYTSREFNNSVIIFSFFLWEWVGGGWWGTLTLWKVDETCEYSFWNSYAVFKVWSICLYQIQHSQLTKLVSFQWRVTSYEVKVHAWYHIWYNLWHIVLLMVYEIFTFGGLLS